MTTSSFRRYTSLPILLDILKEKRLTLLDPRSWDDKNDSYYLELYKTKRDLKSVLALCFAEVPETYHIWRVFAGDSNGVCIEFDKDMLLGYFDIGGVRRGYVEYLTLGRLKKNESRDLNQLPFMKRHAFRDEKEFRFIYESKEEAISAKGVPIKLNCIQRIIFNPWIHQSIFNSVKSVIEGIDGCDKITIDKTSLVDNEQWKALGREISNSADATE